MSAEVKDIFSQVFGREPDVCAFAPGRVNLIGEHTDYNGGNVLPCALNLGIKGAARLRDDKTIRLYSANFPDKGIAYSANFPDKGITEISFSSPLCGEWTDYPLSVIRTFAAMGYVIDRGADLVFSGNLPDGSGLSSSAALEVLTGLLLKELYGFSVTAQELAVFGQFAENRFIGVNCGIMDQFASAMGKSGSAILLDSATLDYSYAPFPENDAALVGVKHSLASSAYNDRRRECESALADINKVKKASSLCALSVDEFERYKDSIINPVCRKRAKHAVYENHRTKQAADALRNGDLTEFGRLMRESHLSLKDDYEVSCAELDFLAEAAWSFDGVYGARMTGGGFGGCTVNLIKKDRLSSFIGTVSEKYRKEFGIDAQIFAVEISSGARVISD